MKKIVITYILTFLLAACGTTQIKPVVIDNASKAFIDQQPVELRKDFEKLFTEGKRNYVLNYMNIGLKARRLGYYKIAESAFIKVTDDLSVMFADSEAARKVRELWYAEDIKDFKGEPYERTMAYYYRGLSLMEKNDFENARAAFKMAILQDAFAEESQNRCDFALVLYMDYLSSYVLNDTYLMSIVGKRLKELRPDFEFDKQINTLFVLELGNSPRKVTDGPGHYQLKFRRGRNFQEKSAIIEIDSKDAFKSYPLEDIYFQASSRGGRPVDKIVKGKAVFKEETHNVGTSLTDISFGATLLSSLDNTGTPLGTVAAAIGIVGSLSLIASQNANPHADSRYWSNLPDTVHVFGIYLPNGMHKYKVKFLDENSEPINDLTKEGSFEISNDKLKIVWLKTR